MPQPPTHADLLIACQRVIDHLTAWADTAEGLAYRLPDTEATPYHHTAANYHALCATLERAMPQAPIRGEE